MCTGSCSFYYSLLHSKEKTKKQENNKCREAKATSENLRTLNKCNPVLQMYIILLSYMSQK